MYTTYPYVLPRKRFYDFTQPTTVAAGDKHGNPMSMLFDLYNLGLIDCTPEDFSELARAYLEYPDRAKRDPNALHAFTDALDKIKWRKCNLQGQPIHLILLGDTLADRGNNDAFMLTIFNRMDEAGISWEILLSNHDAGFLDGWRRNKELLKQGLPFKVNPATHRDVGNMKGFMQTLSQKIQSGQPIDVTYHYNTLLYMAHKIGYDVSAWKLPLYQPSPFVLDPFLAKMYPQSQATQYERHLLLEHTKEKQVYLSQLSCLLRWSETLTEHFKDVYWNPDELQESNIAHILLSDSMTYLFRYFNLLTKDDRAIAFNAIDKIVQHVYVKRLNLLQVSFNSKTNTVTLFSHAPVGLKNIEDIASYLQVPFNFSSGENIVETITNINKAFKQLNLSDVCQTLDDIFYNDPSKYCTHPLMISSWQRFGDEGFDHVAQMPAQINGVNLQFVHGHTEPCELSHVRSLDDLMGKTSYPPELFINPQAVNVQANNIFSLPTPMAPVLQPLKTPSSPVRNSTQKTTPPNSPSKALRSTPEEPAPNQPPVKKLRYDVELPSSGQVEFTTEETLVALGLLELGSLPKMPQHLRFLSSPATPSTLDNTPTGVKRK